MAKITLTIEADDAYELLHQLASLVPESEANYGPVTGVGEVLRATEAPEETAPKSTRGRKPKATDGAPSAGSEQASSASATDASTASAAATPGLAQASQPSGDGAAPDRNALKAAMNEHLTTLGDHQRTQKVMAEAAGGATRLSEVADEYIVAVVAALKADMQA